MGKTTVLYITDVFYKLAGSEKNLFDVVAHLNKKKYEPIVMCLEGSGILNLFKTIGVEAIDLKLKRIYSPQAIIKAIKIFKLIKHRNVKIVVTYHESSDFFVSIIAKIAGAPIIISSRRDMGYNLKKRHVFIYKFINNFFDKILTVSDAVKNRIFVTEHVLWGKLITVHNGVELSRFDRPVEKSLLKQSLALANDRPIIGIVAALRPIKGHKYFIEAASLILKEIPNAYFLIIGWPDKLSYYNELINFTKKLEIEKNVIFIGGRSNTAEMLSIIDISVLSSINEGFPNAVLESMAAGKPVVATKSGGTAEAVIEGKTGFLVDPCDSVALAKAILKLLRNNKLSQEMGRNGREYVAQKFSINRMMSGIESLFDNLLSEKLLSKTLTSERQLDWESLRITFLKIIKLSLSSVFYHTGLTFFVRKSVTRKNKLLILAYHRINNSEFDPLWMNITLQNFEEHLRFIKRNYNPTSLERAVDLIRNREKIPEGTIAVTFDDGYRDNYTNAFSLLNKYAIPATIFLSVDSINKNEELWYDQIIDVFKNTQINYIKIKTHALKSYILDSQHNKAIAAREIVTYAKFLTKNEREKFIIYLQQVLGVNVKKQEYQMLSWEEIKIMRNAGLSFGSHGMTHSILTQLAINELNEEIALSKSIIKEKTGIETKLFAFPNGGVSDFNDNINHVLKENNYIAAFTLLMGFNDQDSNLFSLNRNCVTKGMESGLFGSFSKALFTAKNFGIFDNFTKFN